MNCIFCYYCWCYCDW